MKTLGQIKNEVAKEAFDCTFLQAATFVSAMEMEGIMNRAVKIYAQQCCENLRERIAENATMKLKEDYMDLSMQDEWQEIDRDKIRNTEIILP